MSELANRKERVQYKFSRHIAAAEGPLKLMLADVDRWPGNLSPRLLTTTEHEYVVAFRDNSRARIRVGKLAAGVQRVDVEHEAAPSNSSAPGVDFEIFWFELFSMLNVRLMPDRLAVATAPGKVNLALQIGPLGSDGYHSVASLYLAVNLRETVSAQLCSTYEVKVAGSFDAFELLAVPTDESNIVVKAAKAVTSFAGTPEPLRITFGIDKHVPIAGGMGGGSADGAAALLVANALLDAKIDNFDLLDMAAGLGADVPFAVQGRTAIGSGTGVQLTAVEDVRPVYLVLILDEGGLSTPAVYKKLDELRAARGEDPTKVAEPTISRSMIRALQAGNPFDLASSMQNDLEEAALALRPDLQNTIDLAIELGAIRAMVSGSGPTVMALVGSEIGAAQLAEQLVKRGKNAIAVSGPATGAELVD
jgi:4-diphosphocytidyl-2-C-methyl-D-erythritol kinase